MLAFPDRVTPQNQTEAVLLFLEVLENTDPNEALFEQSLLEALSFIQQPEVAFGEVLLTLLTAHPVKLQLILRLLTYLQSWKVQAYYQHLDHFVALYQRMLTVIKPGEKIYLQIKLQLGEALAGRYALNLLETDLQQALALYRRALRQWLILPESARDWKLWGLLNLQLANSLAYRYLLQKTEADIKAALVRAELARRIFRQQGMTRDLALTETCLGQILTNRYRVKRNEKDIQQAFDYFETALQYRQATTDPAGYAHTRTCQANSLRTRYETRRELADINRAIELCQETLRVRPVGYDLAGQLESWANLGTALGARYDVSKKHADISQAIAAFEQALSVFSFQPTGNPADDSTTLNFLGNALQKRYNVFKEEQDISRAIAAFEQALLFRTVDRGLTAHAGLQTNLGNALQACYWSRQEAIYINRAVDCYQIAAQLVKGRDANIYAHTQNNLGYALSSRYTALNDSADLQAAVYCYRQALKIRRHSQNPVGYAQTQANLGSLLLTAYRQTGQAHFERYAARHLQNALQVYTLERDPTNFATTQANLGALWAALYANNPAATAFEKALACYNAALLVRSPERDPSEYAQLLFRLGQLWSSFYANTAEQSALAQAKQYYRQATSIAKALRDLDTAADYYRAWAELYAQAAQPARQIVALVAGLRQKEGRRQELLSPAERNRRQQQDISLGDNALDLALQNGFWNAAYRLVANFKARSLLEQIKRRNVRDHSQTLRPNFQAEAGLTARFEELCSEVEQTERDLLEKPTLVAGVAAAKARLTLNKFIRHEVSRIDPTFAALTGESPVRARQLARALPPRVVLLEHWILPDRVVTFVIHSGVATNGLSRAEVIECPTLTAERLTELGQNWLNATTETDLSRRQKIEAAILQEIAAQLYQPLLNLPVLQKARALLIVPNWILYLFPLHALPLDQHNYLSDRYRISYMPSSALWLQQRNFKPVANQQSSKVCGLAADPWQQLRFAQPELSQLQALVEQAGWQAEHVWLRGNAATRQALKVGATGSRLVHISSHGLFNYRLSSPEGNSSEIQAGLLLYPPKTPPVTAPASDADENILISRAATNLRQLLPAPAKSGLSRQEVLTLDEIADDLNLSNTELVFLAACDSGRHSVERTDAFMGLPYAFLFAGAQNVLATLWPVNDFSAFLLSCRFYQNWLLDGQPPGLALAQAAAWLRRLTVEELCNSPEIPLDDVTIENWVNLDSGETRAISTLSLAATYRQYREYYMSEAARHPADLAWQPFADYFHWAAFVLIGQG